MTTIDQSAAVILAAGASKRFGDANKLLHMIDGTPMIRRTADAVIAAGVPEIVIVTGQQATEVEGALAGLPVRCVRNATPWDGMGTSLAVGANAVANDPQALFILLGDMPFLKPTTLTTLLAVLNPAIGHDIVVPVHDGRRGHPVLFTKFYFTRLRALSGDVGARHLLKNHPERVRAVPVDDPGTLIDIDTPDDAAALKKP